MKLPRITVSGLLLAAESWDLLDLHLSGSAGAWKQSDGFRKGELPGAIFHDRIAAPFFRDLRAGALTALASRIVDAADDGPAIARAVRSTLEDRYLAPLLGSRAATLDGDQVIGIGLAVAQLAAACGDLLGTLPRPTKPAHVQEWVLPPETLYEAEYVVPAGLPLRIAGRFDAALFDPVRSAVTVIDFKCRSAGKPQDILQIALYAWLIEAATGWPASGMVLYLGTGGAPVFHTARELECLAHASSTEAFIARVRDAVLARSVEDATGVPGAPVPPIAPAAAIAPHSLPSADVATQPAIEARELTARVLAALATLGCAVTALEPIVGPRVIRCRVVPVLGKTSVKKIMAQGQDLQIPLDLPQPPFIETAGGHVAIDLPRRAAVPVLLEDLMAARDGRPSPVTFPLGVAIDGAVRWIDLAQPTETSVLVGGMAGSGKTEMLKSAVVAMCASASTDELEVVLVDPKRVSFGPLATLPHVKQLLFDAEETMPAVAGMVADMESRYALFATHGVENIEDYVRRVGVLPHRVLVVDEYADLMSDKAIRKDLESMVQRLCQKGRAAGVHLILATQRPDATVVSPLVKANLHIKVALKVASRTNSQIILDEPGAEMLLGRGDMFAAGMMARVRLQSPMITAADIERARAPR